MELLTGKAKEDFLQWNEDNDAPLSTYAIEQGLIYGTVLNAMIIEWLDSVGIIILINNVMDDWWFRVKSKNKVVKSEKYNELKSRQEATEQAIIKANEIYNSL